MGHRCLKLLGSMLLVGVLAPTGAQSLVKAHELWATVDVCNAKDRPHTIGIRGSMPSDGHPKDVMYMRLRVQFLNASTKEWLNFSKGGDSGFEPLGAGAFARQTGLSVLLAPVAGRPPYTLRGYAVFQWRRGTTVVQSATRITTSGHRSLAGADPRGFSAATCRLK
jgi:hypothetical protein